MATGTFPTTALGVHTDVEDVDVPAAAVEQELVEALALENVVPRG
jgi:hypothetical protein